MSLADLIRDLSESLKPPEDKPRTHGCYYVVEGQEPERCVLEYGRPQDCVFATRLVAEGKDQTTCQYWKPLRAQQTATRSTESRPSESRPSGFLPSEWHKPTKESGHRTSDRRESDHRESDYHQPERHSKPPAAVELKEPEAAPVSADAIRELLQDRNALIQAVITREILDKPKALRRGRR